MRGLDGLDLTAPLREAIAEAERLIASAPSVETEQDLLEGYAYPRHRANLQLIGLRDTGRHWVLKNPSHPPPSPGEGFPHACRRSV